jgi:Chaperone of endosialidase
MKTLIGSINRSPLRCGFFTLAIVLCCFALSPPLKAQDCPTECGAGGNTAVGINALDSVNPAGNGINNTAVGTNALTNDTTGQYNVAVGSGALANNTSGDFNMAIGAEALRDNVANFNLAIGFRVLFQNTTGNHLTGVGAAAMRNNTSASDNTAIGADALRENTTTEFNLAVGDRALTAFNGTTAGDGANTALGSIALVALTSGQENVAVGRRALQTITDGDNNVGVGWRTGDGVATGSFLTFLGSQAGNTEGPNVSDVVCIQESGDTNGGEQTNNRTYIGNIRGVVVGDGNGIPVIIDGDGQLGTSNVSSRRFKKDIKPMDHKTSEAVLALKPVTFQYKKLDSKKAEQTPQFGLIAEDVAEVNPDLVLRDDKGEVSYVRYDAVNILLLNEFLKEHKKVEEQQASIADLKSTVALQQKEMQVLTAQLKEQAAQIQKVSAQLEASKPAPKVVANK